MLEKEDLQTIGELISQGIQTYAQSQGVSSGVTKGGSETIFEDVATGERLTKQQAAEENINYMNMKRTYDSHQSADLDVFGRNRIHFDKMTTVAQGHTERLYAIAENSLESSVSRDNIVNSNAGFQANVTNSQVTAHRDVATNEQWNLSEQNWLIVAALKDKGISDATISSIVSRMPSEPKPE